MKEFIRILIVISLLFGSLFIPHRNDSFKSGTSGWITDTISKKSPTVFIWRRD